MNSLSCIFVLIVLVFGIFLYRPTKLPLLGMCEMEKCPYCYGTDFCDQFKQNSITVSEISIFDLVANYIGVKNVFYAHYQSSSVVLKKLGHNFELAKLDGQICADNNAGGDNCDLFKLNDTQDYINKIVRFLNSSGADEVRHFKICSTSAAEKFLNLLLDVYNKHLASGSRATLLKNVWSILQVNAEPLLMQLLKSEDHWPVPRYLGACGRIIVESYCGLSLNAFASTDWNTRASLALQLLEAAINFTERHADFRFYLTDISPDNIAVNSELKVAFVDLENAIVVSRDASGSNIHHSTNFDDEDGFAFSEQELCGSSISDHNYYSVCKLILSENASWPMMQGGLLHSPPRTILETYFHLFDAIEACAHKQGQMDCFEAVKIATGILRKILS